MKHWEHLKNMKALKVDDKVRVRWPGAKRGEFDWKPGVVEDLHGRNKTLATVRLDSGGRIEISKVSQFVTEVDDGMVSNASAYLY